MYLSPRDAFGLFEQVLSRSVAVGAAPTVIADENPDRVVLVIGSAQSLATVPAPAGHTGTAGGFFRAASADPLIFTQQMHGNLAQCGWTCTCPGGAASIAITEIILRRYPGWDK